jgi:RecA-family ATPase
LGWNAHNVPPLEESKVRETVASIARTHARNHPVDEMPDTPLFDVTAASVSRFFGKDVPARDWVLEDCLPRGKTALLVAPGGTGKSQLVLQLGYAIATGRAGYSPWKPGRPGHVVIIGAEDEEDEVHRRFERLWRADMNHLEVDETLQRLRENLFVIPRVGEDNLLTRDDGKEVRQTGLVERIAKAVAPLEDLRVIVIDPAARFRGGEENSAEDTTRFVEAVETLAKLTGAAVIVVHHVNKSSMQGGDANQSASRGSSALSDGVRLQINLGHPNQEEQEALGSAGPGKYLVVRITKTNYTAVGEPIYLRRDDEGRLFRLDMEQQKQSRDKEQIAQLVSILREEYAQKREYSKSSFATRYGGREGPFQMGQASLKQLIERAVRDGQVEMLPGKENLLRPVERIPKARIVPPAAVVEDGAK